MQVENRFEIPLPPALAWSILMNIPESATCFPGASAIEAITAEQYKGRVTVKLGPLTMVFAGKLRIEDRDDSAYCAAIHANWSEIKGRGNAITVTRFVLQEYAGGTQVSLQSDLQLAGQVAQYGRGVGMISAISAQLISSFADNLRTKIQAGSSDGAAAPESQSVPEISGLTLIVKALGNRLKN